jgi:hypothetical protein
LGDILVVGVSPTLEVPMRTFTLVLTRDEVIALGRAIQDKWDRIMQHPVGSMDDLYTVAPLAKVIEKLPEPEELETEA